MDEATREMLKQFDKEHPLQDVPLADVRRNALARINKRLECLTPLFQEYERNGKFPQYANKNYYARKIMYRGEECIAYPGALSLHPQGRRLPSREVVHGTPKQMYAVVYSGGALRFVLTSELKVPWEETKWRGISDDELVNKLGPLAVQGIMGLLGCLLKEDAGPVYQVPYLAPGESAS